MKNKTLNVLVFVSLILLMTMSTGTAYSPSKYKPIHINNTGGSELTYYPVLLNVTYSTGMQTDFDDLRVKYYNGDEWVFVPYWIEKKVNNEWCKLWFNATSIPANSWCNDTYYLFYGDNLANSESDFDSVFIREIDGLNASWHFDEGEGTTAYDTSGNDNDGTIYGASWTDGKFGKALSYDGSNDYVDYGSDESFNMSDKFAIVLWVNRSSKTNFERYLSNSIDIDNYAYEMGVDWNNPNKWRIRLNNDNVTLTATMNSNAKEWAHVVYQYDKDLSSNNLKIYENSNLLNSIDFNETLTNHGKLMTNRQNKNDGWANSIIDEMYIFNRTLTSEEISDLYNYYGYTTENYPGKVLVRKRIDPEPTTTLGGTQIINPSDAVVTLAPSNVKSNSLTMRGWLNYAPADVWIEWGTEHGGHVFKTSSKHMDDLGWITFDVTSPILFANKKYKYRAVAVIEGTTYYGEDYVFTMGDADIPDIVKNNTFSESYNMINYTNLTTEAFALAIINVWTSVWGSFFWVLICGFPFILMYITQHNTTIPGVLAMILGGTMLIYLPPEWQSVAYSLLIVAVAGIMVGIFKSKR